MSTLRISTLGMLALLIPTSLALAQETPTTLGGFLGVLTDIINIIIPIIFALVFLTISWGVIKAWIMGDASEGDVDAGKKIVTVGIIVLVIMSAIWGIVRLIQQGLFG